MELAGNTLKISPFTASRPRAPTFSPTASWRCRLDLPNSHQMVSALSSMQCPCNRPLILASNRKYRVWRIKYSPSILRLARTVALRLIPVDARSTHNICPMIILGISSREVYRKVFAILTRHSIFRAKFALPLGRPTADMSFTRG